MTRPFLMSSHCFRLPYQPPREVSFYHESWNLWASLLYSAPMQYHHAWFSQQILSFAWHCLLRMHCSLEKLSLLETQMTVSCHGLLSLIAAVMHLKYALYPLKLTKEGKVRLLFDLYSISGVVVTTKFGDHHYITMENDTTLNILMIPTSWAWLLLVLDQTWFGSSYINFCYSHGFV